MKNWLIPVAVLGVSGLGLLFASERGREQLRSIVDRITAEADPFAEFSNFLDEQLTAIQRTLDSVARALDESQA